MQSFILNLLIRSQKFSKSMLNHQYLFLEKEIYTYIIFSLQIFWTKASVKIVVFCKTKIGLVNRIKQFFLTLLCLCFLPWVFRIYFIKFLFLSTKMSLTQRVKRKYIIHIMLIPVYQWFEPINCGCIRCAMVFNLMVVIIWDTSDTSNQLVEAEQRKSKRSMVEFDNSPLTQCVNCIWSFPSLLPLVSMYHCVQR